MKKYFSFFLIIFIIGCSKKGLFQPPFYPSKYESLPDWFFAKDFPVTIGREWKYVIKEEEKEKFFTLKVIELKKIHGQICFVIESDTSFAIDHFFGFWFFDLSPVKKIYWSFEKKILINHGFSFEFKNEERTIDFVPSRNLFDFPLYDQKTWVVDNFYLQDGDKCEYKRTAYKVHQPLIKVYQGEYETADYNIYRVEEKMYIDDNEILPVMATYWLAKGIGIIKYEFIKRDKDFNTYQVTVMYYK